MTDSDPKSLLKGLHSDTLHDLYLKDNPDQRGQKVSKQAVLSDISNSIEQAGVKTLLANLKREHLALLLAKTDVEFKDDDNKNSKAVLAKKLTSLIDKEGAQDFLNEHASEDVLKAIAEALDVEPESEKKADLVAQIGTTLRHIGLEVYFNSFDVDLLHDVADDLKLKTHNTHNKRKLVDSIVTKKDVEKEPKAKKAKIEVGKKKPIEKGQTYQGIFQHYYANEVRDYCRDHGLKTTGNKSALIKRILAHFEGDESAKAGAKSGKGKKGTGKSKKADADGEGAEENNKEKGDEKKKGSK